MNKKIFLACDTTNLDQIRKIIKETKTKKLKIGYKFGLEFFYSKSGRSFLSKINKNKIIFLDLKLNDIPNTCSAAIASLKDLKNVKYLTVHINGGYKMLKEVKKTARTVSPKILSFFFIFFVAFLIAFNISGPPLILTVRYFIFFKSFKELTAETHVFGISFSFKSKNIVCFLSIFDKNDLPDFE